MEHRCVSQRGFQKRAFHFRQDPRRQDHEQTAGAVCGHDPPVIGSAVLYYFGSYRALVREGQELSDILVRQTKTAFTTSINNTTRAIFDNYKVQLLSNCLTGQDDGENYYATPIPFKTR